MIILSFRISFWEVHTAVWVQLSKFWILLRKNEGPLGYNSENLYFPVSTAIWVHTLANLLITLLIFSLVTLSQLLPWIAISCFSFFIIFYLLFLLEDLMRIDFSSTVFSTINHWFGVALAESGDDFSIIYILITILVNDVYSKFNNVTNSVFHWKKGKLII